MNFCRQALIPLFFIVLSYVCLCCTSPPVPQGTKYYNSFRLTRFTRTRVQQLLKRYKEQQLGDEHFEDRSLQMSSLPLLSIEFYSWLDLKDFDRLHAAYRDLHTYWNMLEQKKRQMRTNEIGQRVVGRHKTNPGIILPASIEYIQHDLRDLMRQINIQVQRVIYLLLISANLNMVYPTSMNVILYCFADDTQTRLWDKSNPSHSSGILKEHPVPSQTLWASRLEGYVILRDLDLYLTKLSRDFLLLISNYTHASLVAEQ
ncbi:LOW QUALITY PROTEIN: uncharacterized protein LOC130117249 [Lampris incognitus]|uniref:LOW QUALITY PROTEIN: uncharacterized protein LOC130117249 n=1 Tax=Lampris incognitus TaxID=2546036 RepID=UPI0024B6128F|nr:LOW QUALITY PROTEIN: uncharacterized protein LOC130117249 [Lampris incognitus]